MKAIIFLTRDCTLRCDYCYIGEKRPESMDPEVLTRAVDWVIDQGDARSKQVVSIGFFGGEPLMRFDLLKFAVEHTLLRLKGTGRRAYFSVATNGMLLTPEVADFLARHRFLVIYSMDGGSAMHDLHRVLPGGGPSFLLVSPGLDLLQARKGPVVDVVMVLTPKNMAHLAESTRYLTEDRGVRHVSVNVDYTAAWSAEQRAPLLEALEATADVVMDRYRAGKPVNINIFDDKIHAYINKGYEKRHFCAFGEGKVGIDINGNLYPCDRIAQDAGDPDLIIGHVDVGIDFKLVGGMLRRLRAKKPRCEDCDYAERCRHWCGCVNYETTGDIGQVSDFFCFLEKRKSDIADRIAETLYAEGNLHFIKKFYGKLLKDNE